MEMLPENIVKGLSEAEVQTRLGRKRQATAACCDY